MADVDEMHRKLTRALREGGDLYSLTDLLVRIDQGLMQSHMSGDTWIITQFNDYPRRRVLSVEMVVGNLEEALAYLPKLYEFAEKHGASRIVTQGRLGWDSVQEEIRKDGWRKVACVYARG